MADSILPRRTRLIPASPDALAAAAAALREGRLVAFPTETVYGLGVDATNAKAVAALYAAKGRPSFNPLIAHVVDLEAAEREGLFSPLARRLAQAFWPGPLTLVVPASAACSVSPLARAGLDTIALRAPSHPVARALLRALGRPVAAPSANPSGRLSPTRADHVMSDLSGRIDLVVDGGPTAIGLESTIVGCFGPKAVLLRAGGVPREAIEAALGVPLAAPEGESERLPLAPGMLASHYAPRARLRLDARDVRIGEAVLDFGARFPSASLRLDLSPVGDLVEAAANVFSFLRDLDALGVDQIAVAPIPDSDLGEALNDRLRRAAAPR